MKIVAGQAGGQTEPVLGGQQLTQTMTNLLQTNVVAERAIRRARIDTSVTKLLKDLHVAVRPDSSVLDVSYESTDKKEAVRVLATIAGVFVAQVEAKLGVRATISQARGKSAPLFFASVFDPPHLEPKQVRPKPLKTIAFALALGLALAIMLILALENLDDTIRNRQAAETSFGAAVLGSVPGRMRKRAAMASARGGGRQLRSATQALQLLRAKVEFGAEADTGTTVVVTSAHHDEGKSALATSLAATLALAGRTVICVDANNGKPQLRRYLAVSDDHSGLGEVLAGTTKLESALQNVALEAASSNGGPEGPAAARFRVLTAGAPRSASSALTPDATKALFAQLRKAAEYVVVIAPPLLVAGDALPLAAAAEHVLVVARQGRVTTADADGVRRSLDEVGARRIGVVLTDV